MSQVKIQSSGDGYNVVFLDSDKLGEVRQFKDDAEAKQAGESDESIHSIKAHRNSKIVFLREKGSK